jgi:hypothetical protein
VKAKAAVKVLKAAVKVVSQGKHNTLGYVAVRAGQLVVTAERDNNSMIAVIDGLGLQSDSLVGNEALALDVYELGQWLKFVGPLLKACPRRGSGNGLGEGELIIHPQGDKCALRIYDKEWPLSGQRVEIGEPPSTQDAELEVTVNAGTLAEVIGQVSGCIAGKDDTRSTLRWVHLVERDDYLCVEAANGFYMAQSRLSYREMVQTKREQHLLPGIDWQFGPLIEALLGIHWAETVKVRVKPALAQAGGEVIAIVGEGFTITVKSEGTFPDTAQIIPRRMIAAPDALLLDVGEVLRALPEAEMQTEYGPSKGTGGVMLYTADEQTLGVKGLGVDPRESGEISWAVFVNAKYLSTLLKSSGCDLLQVKWDYTHPSGTIVFADDGDWIGLLMPLFRYSPDGGQKAGIARKEVTA